MLKLFKTMLQHFVQLKIVIVNSLFNITLELFYMYNLYVHAQHSVVKLLKLLTHTITFRSLTPSKILLLLILYYCKLNVWACCWNQVVTNHLNELLSHFTSIFSAYLFYLRFYLTMNFGHFKCLNSPCRHLMDSI